MNPYLPLERLEFFVTAQCTGRCKHCSAATGNQYDAGSYPDLGPVLSATDYLLSHFAITSIMTFGGEPLLFPDTVAAIHNLGRIHGVAARELITNGFFTTDNSRLRSVVTTLIGSGVTRIFLSVDAFHQEHIAQERIRAFIDAVLSTCFENITLHPAWVVSREHGNQYNARTKEILDALSEYRLPVSQGNNIVLSGSAKEHLAPFYPTKPALNVRCGSIPHTNSADCVRSIRLLPNGNISICRALVIGNIYASPIQEILARYQPYENPITSLLLQGGVTRLHTFAAAQGHSIPVEQYYNPCDLCADCLKAIRPSSPTIAGPAGS